MKLYRIPGSKIAADARTDLKSACLAALARVQIKRPPSVHYGQPYLETYTLGIWINQVLFFKSKNSFHKESHFQWRTYIISDISYVQQCVLYYEIVDSYVVIPFPLMT